MAELEVVKISSLDELGHINMSLDAIFVKRLLEHLVVLNKLVFGLGLPLNFTEGEGSWVKGVENGTVNGASRALLNLCQLQ